MVTKFIIELTHNRLEGADILYYTGQAGTVPVLDYRKAKAKRYTFEHEAIHDMNILRAMYKISTDTFKVISIRCRA